MLLRFKFKNFKSFRDDTSLNLSANKLTDFSHRVITIGREQILPVAAVFGANASGKSNLLEAFRYMRNYVINSFAFGGEKEDKKNFLGPTPFLLDNLSRSKESVFEVYYIDSEEDGAKTYNYGFSVNENGIVEEWLNTKARTARNIYKKIFYRNVLTGELDLSGIAKKHHENIKAALEQETLMVSLGAKLKMDRLKSVRDWFCNTKCLNFGNLYENYRISKAIPRRFIEDERVRRKVVEYFSCFDPSIVDLQVETDYYETDKTASKIKAYHKTIDSNDLVAIPFEDESAGTLKMFALYQCLEDILESGGVLLVDELDARLHPLLVRYLLTTFLDPELNLKRAQLLFTLHDSWQLANNLLRRDEIWFAKKNMEGISTICSLADTVDEDGRKAAQYVDHEKTI